jgi:hypothetical protein
VCVDVHQYVHCPCFESADRGHIACVHVLSASLPSPPPPQDFVTLQFIPPGTDLQPILPVLAKVFDQVSMTL